MQQSTKQRIVGTVVLLALALIFLPIVFDGQGSYQAPLTSRIPDPPPVAVLPEPTQSRPVILADTMPSVDEEEEPESSLSPSEEFTDDNLQDIVERIEQSSIAANADAEDSDNAEIAASEPDFTRDPPALGPDGLPQGWSVRLGSFSDAGNAQNLLQRLQDSGYRAYTRSIESEQGSLTRVFVGPWLDRARVESYQRELQSQFQLAGMIVRFQLAE